MASAAERPATTNGGSARHRGFEPSLQPQFNSLPGSRPTSAHLARRCQLNRFRVSAQASRVDTWLISVASNAASIPCKSPRAFVSAKFSCRVPPRTSVYLDLENLTKEPVNNRCTVYSDRRSITRQWYPSIGFGRQGRIRIPSRWIGP